MGWKCAPQVMGLVRGEPKPGQKHRMNGEKMAKEAGYERASKSSTFDRKRSHLNVYEGYKSGKEFWTDLAAEADEYKAKVRTKTKDGKEVVRERKLRQDAVIGFAMIFNPPAEVCMGWSDEEYAKFYSDAEACMEEIEPRIFRKKNIRMRAEHFDEGIPPEEGVSEEELKGVISRHIHELGICVDEDGNYCGNLIDAKLMDRINREFPRLMRERGWKDMEDMDVTDWEKAKTDKEYAQERNAKRRKNGRSVNTHIAEKLHDKMQEVNAMMVSAEELKASAEQMVSDAELQVESVMHDVEIEADEEINRRIREADVEIKAEIEKRVREADAEIRDRKREADEEIEKRHQETDAEIDERKRYVEDARSAYLQLLYNELDALRIRTGREDVADDFKTITDIQEAITAEFQVLEDSLDAQARAEAESEIADARAALQESKDQYEAVKQALEKIIEEDSQPVTTSDIHFIVDVMKVIGTSKNPKVKDAASTMIKIIQAHPEGIVDAYNKVKAFEADIIRQRIKESEARLVEVTGSGQPDEHNHGRKLPDLDFD